MVGTRTEVSEYDVQSDQAVVRELLKTRTKVRGRGNGKMAAVLQIECLEWLVQREAGQIIRRW